MIIYDNINSSLLFHDSTIRKVFNKKFIQFTEVYSLS